MATPPAPTPTAEADAPAAPKPGLPPRGVAMVKSVLSGDTVVLQGRAVTPGSKPPQLVFTFERVTAPRMASKANNNTDDPGAFPAREWLRQTCVGKSVTFESRKQGVAAGERIYGMLFMASPSGDGTKLNLAVECVRNGHATPKVFGGLAEGGEAKEEEDANGGADAADPIHEYEKNLQQAFQEAKAASLGIHSPSPMVRRLKNSGEDFETLSLVEKSKSVGTKTTVKCVIEHIFDGSRLRCLVTDPEMDEAGLLHGSFTLILAGVVSPRLGNPRLDPPTQSEPFAEAARDFVEIRLLQRELEMSLLGTDKSGVCAVGTIHHPKGNISLELLKNGLGRISDWSSRMMDPAEMPAFRMAENSAKKNNTAIWQGYTPPKLSGEAEVSGVVLEVLSGDTLSILPTGVDYDSEAKLKKISLASIRSPRVGNERMGKADEPYAVECKDRLRVLTVGKGVKVEVNYERDIPMGENTEKRQFGTVSVGRREDVAEVLVSEGLAVTQRHRDDDEKSPRYDELVVAENAAKAAKKGMHSGTTPEKKHIADLTDPKKAKAYSETLMRAGTLKGIVEYVFNGSRFKIYVPSQPCHLIFALNNVRCPQPSPNVPVGGAPARAGVKAAEPFGDASKRHARLAVLQKSVEIVCKGVTQGGVLTGELFIVSGTGQKKDFSQEMVEVGLAFVDQRKIDYDEAPRILVEAQTAAQTDKIGMWSTEEQQSKTKSAVATPAKPQKEQTTRIQLSEIRDGHHFFFRSTAGDGGKGIDDAMKKFTASNGTAAATCDLRKGRLVAALFNDGSGNSWYRAKVVERVDDKRARVLFVDHGNVASLLIAKQMRPLSPELSTERYPAAAKEGVLALTAVRSLDEEDGVDAARMLQSLAWGKTLTAQIHGEVDGQLQITLYDDSQGTSINEQMVGEGLARLAKKSAVDALLRSVVDKANLLKLSEQLSLLQTQAHKKRIGMWRFGDVGDDDDEE